AQPPSFCAHRPPIKSVAPRSASMAAGRRSKRHPIHHHNHSLEETKMATAKALPGKTLLNGADHTLILIDFQSQMAFATRSIDVVDLRNNAALVAKAAAEFNVPTILTTVAEKTFSGPMFSEVTGPFPEQAAIDRTTMNTWEDENVIKQVNKIGKNRIVFGGL